MQTLSLRSATALCAILFCALPQASAQTLYWDTNLTDPGASSGTTAPGEWDQTSVNWTTSSDGTGTATTWPSTTSVATAVFSAGTNATGTYTITVFGKKEVGTLLFEEGQVTLFGENDNLTGLNTIQVDFGATAIIDIDIGIGGVAGFLSKTGDGTAIFTGNNSYTQGTEIRSGMLRLSGADATIAGDVVNDGTFELDRSSDRFFNGLISGTGSVTVKSGIERFSQAQTYTGATTIESGGILVLATTVDQGLSAATTVDVQGGGIFDFSNSALTIAGLTGGGSVYSFGGSDGNLSLNIADGDTSTFTGTLGANRPDFALTKTGSGTQILSGTNTYTGSTTLLGGTLSIAADAALGAAPATATPGHLTLDGGTLATTADFALNANRGIALGTGGGTFDTAAGTSLGFDGNVAGSGTLTKAGMGTLTLSGDNSYTGATTISAGTLTLGDGGTGGSFASPSVANEGAFVINRSVDQTLAADISGSGDLVKDGGGTLKLTGDNSYTGSTTISSGTLSLGDGGAGGAFASSAVANEGTFVINRSDDQNLAFNISGSGDLVKEGAGTLTLSGNNSYTGSTSISGGSLSIAADAALGAAPAAATPGHLTLDGGTLATTSDFALNANRGIALGSSGGTFDTADGSSLSVAGTMDGSGGLTKTGAGTLALSGAKSYTGSTTINEGTLTIAADAALGAAPGTPTPGHLTLNGGTLATTDSFFLSINRGLTFGASGGTLDTASGTTLSYAGQISGAFTKAGAGVLMLTNFDSLNDDVTIADGTLDWNVEDSAFFKPYSGNLSGSGDLVLTLVSSATIGLEGANTYTGRTTVIGGAVRINADAALGSAPEAPKPGQLTLTNGTLRATADLTLHANRGIALNNGGVFDTYGAAVTIEGDIAGSGGLIKAGSGTLALLGDNSYTGSTTISAGTLTLGDGAFASPSVVNNGTFVIDRTVDQDMAADISGSGNLIKDGAGTLALTGNNSYTGGTAIQGGTLQVGAGGTSGSLVGDVSNQGILAFDRADALSYSGVISGTGALTKSGGGTLTLAGANTFTGESTITAGTLLLGHADALQNSTVDLSGGLLGFGALTVANLGGIAGSQDLALTNQTEAAVALSVGSNDAETTYGGVLSGDGTLIKLGTGNLTLSGNNSYTGGTTISAGTLTVGAGGTTGGLTANVANEGTLQFNRSDSSTYGGVISGTGDLIQSGGGELTLTGNNSYSGNTTIQTGILTLGDGGTGGSLASSTVVNDGTLAINRSVDQNFGGAISGSGSLVKDGTGTLTLSGNNSYTGSTTISGGTLSIAADAALGSAPGTATPGHLTLDGGTLATTADFALNANRGIALGTGGGTLETAAGTSFSIEGDVAGSGALTKSGGGTLTLPGANSYTGSTTVSGGTLSIAADAALGAAPGAFTPGHLTLDGGSLATTADMSLAPNRGLATGPSGGTLMTAADTELSYAGVIGGSGPLTKAGAGDLSLTAANAVSSVFNLSEGTLSIGDVNTLADAELNLIGGSLGFNDLHSARLRGLSGSSGLVLNNASGQGVDLTVGADGLTTAHSGILSGSGSINKVGSGTLALRADNTYTGATTVSDGTLILSGDGTEVTNASVLRVENGALLSVTGSDYSQNAPLTLTGGSSMTTALDLTLANGEQNADLVVESGSNLSVDREFIMNLAQNGGTGSPSALVTGVNSSLSAGFRIIMRTGSLTINSGGSVTTPQFYLLGAENTSLNVDNGGRLQTGQIFNSSIPGLGEVSLAGGTIASTQSGLSTDLDLALATGTSSTLDASEGDIFWDGTVSGGGDLALTGSGFVYFRANDNTFTGDVAINAGALTLSHADGSAQYANSFSGTGGLSKSNAGSVLLSGANTYSGLTQVSGGALRFDNRGAFYNDTVDSTTAARLVVNAGTVSFDVGGAGYFSASDLDTLLAHASFANGSRIGIDTSDASSGTFTYGSVIADTNGGSNALGLEKTGAGHLTLTGANTYSGGTLLEAGTLTLGHASALGATTGSLQLDGGTLDLGSHSPTLGAVIFNGGGFINGSLDNASSFELRTGQLSDDLGGAAALSKTGSGLFVLSGSNTYAGNTSITNGTLTFANTGSFYGGTVDAANAAKVSVSTGAAVGLGFGGAGYFSLSDVDTFLANTSFASGALIAIDTTAAAGGTVTWNDAATGAVGLQKQGSGRLILTGTPTGTGPLDVAGGILQIGDGAPTAFPYASLSHEGEVDFGHSGDLTIAVDETGSGALTISGGGTVDFTGSIALNGTGDLNITAGTLRALRPHLNRTVLVSGENSTFELGTSRARIGAAVGASGSLTVADGGTLRHDSTSSSSFRNLAVGQSLESTGELHVTGPGSSLISSSTIDVGYDGNGTFRVSDGGTASFTNSNISEVGDDSRSTGLIELTGVNTALDFSGPLRIARSGNGTVIIDSGATLTAPTIQLAENLDGTGTLNLNTGGTLVTGALTQGSGTATINLGGGTLRATADFASAPAANLATGTTSTLDTNGNSITWSGELSGAGGLAKTGAGTLTLGGANTYTGSTTVNEGTLRQGRADALAQTNVIHMGPIGTFALNGFAAGVGGIAGSGAVELGANTLTVNGTTTSDYSGSLSGSGGLFKTGSGNQTISGANSYSGGTTVEGGTLVAANSTGSAFGSSGVVVANGGTLGGSGSFTGSLSIGNGGILAPGNSPGTLSSGDTTFGAGGSYVWEVNDVNGAAGTNWDLLDVTGTLTIEATGANPFTIAVTSLDGSDQAGEVANFDDQLDYSFLLATTTDGVELGAGATIIGSAAVDTSAFANSFIGAWSVVMDGNDLYLAYAVPEPRLYSTLLGLAALAMAVLRRRVRH